MKNCIYEPVFDLFLLFNFQIDSALTFSSRLNHQKRLPHISEAAFILYCILLIAFYYSILFIAIISIMFFRI